MQLKPEGARVAQLDPPAKINLANQLMNGTKNIGDYTDQGVCYEAAAFVRFLLGAAITPDEIRTLNGHPFRDKFDFCRANGEWDGVSNIPIGTAVGFLREEGNVIFHAAIAVGGTSIRAVNGGDLGLGWQSVDLKAALSVDDRWPNGAFKYDRAHVRVYYSIL